MGLSGKLNYASIISANYVSIGNTTSGTFTSEQLNILKNDRLNYIDRTVPNVGHDIYKLNAEGIDENGANVYVTTKINLQDSTTSAIVVDMSTGSWSLVSVGTSSVIANPTLIGGEAGLTSLGVNGVNYKVEAFPSEADAGDAIVYNGTEWTKQSGYGYTTDESGTQTITWTGDTTGRDNFIPSGISIAFYKIGEKPTEYPATATAKIVASGQEYTGDATIFDGTGAKLYFVLDAQTYIFICEGGDFSITAQGTTITGNAPSAGIYCWNIFVIGPEVTSVSFIFEGTIATVHQIDSKYIPVDTELANAKTTHGIGWTTPSSGETLTWDGTTTGRETVTLSYTGGTITYCKISSTVPSSSTLIGATITTTSSTGTITSSDILDEQTNGYSLQHMVLVNNATGNFTLTVGSTSYTINLPSTGIWFGNDSGGIRVSGLSWGEATVNQISSIYIPHDTTKQDTLVSGTNIKTINNTSILSSGNLSLQETLVSGTNIKTINNNSILGSGNVSITGLPTGTAAGNALVYDGSSWTQQDGYGYSSTDPITVTITWTGDTTGRDKFAFPDYPTQFYYKVADKPLTNPSAGTISCIASGQEYSRSARVWVGTGATLYGDSDYQIYICDGGDFSIRAWGVTVTGTAPSSGVYFMDIAGTSTTSASLIFESTTTTVHQINSKYMTAKQDVLVSGTSIKTINSTSILGSGDLAVQPTLVSGTNIKTINNTSILGSGNIVAGPTIEILGSDE